MTCFILEGWNIEVIATTALLSTGVDYLSHDGFNGAFYTTIPRNFAFHKFLLWWSVRRSLSSPRLFANLHLTYLDIAVIFR